MRLFKQIGMFLLLPVIILIDSHLGQFVNSFFPHLQIEPLYLHLLIIRDNRSIRISIFGLLLGSRIYIRYLLLPSDRDSQSSFCDYWSNRI